MTTSGVATRAVVNYTEIDPAFWGGDSVFARNWPYMYALAGTEDYPDVTPEQIGIAPLPLAEGENQVASALGGWNLLISATSDKQEEAWEFVRFMTSEESQKIRALEATLLPTRTSLYSDSEIQEKVPGVALGEQTLKGDASPQEAVGTLQGSLQEIVEAGS